MQLKFVLLLQQHVCRAAPPSADPTKPVSANTTDQATGSSSDLVRLLLVPSILRQMVELTKEMLVL